MESITTVTFNQPADLFGCASTSLRSPNTRNTVIASIRKIIRILPDQTRLLLLPNVIPPDGTRVEEGGCRSTKGAPLTEFTPDTTCKETSPYTATTPLDKIKRFTNTEVGCTRNQGTSYGS